MATDDSMRLPPGKTCADCRRYTICQWLFACPAMSEICDWSPSRFIPLTSIEESMREVASLHAEF